MGVEINSAGYLTWNVLVRNVSIWLDPVEEFCRISAVAQLVQFAGGRFFCAASATTGSGTSTAATTGAVENVHRRMASLLCGQGCVKRERETI